MRLFISNFKQEASVLGLVALALLSGEIGLRKYGVNLSLDLQHIQAIPRIVSAMKNADGPTLLFLGNSLTRRAVMPEVLMEEFTKHGYSRIHIAKIHPDDTNIADWYYIYKRDVHAMGADPSLLLVGFAEDQLSDLQVRHVDRLGGYFAGLGSVSEAFRNDILEFNNQIDFLLSGISCAYANRDRFRTQVLGMIIPHYKTSAQVLNMVMKNRGDVPRTRIANSYKRLERFLELTKDTPTKVIFIAIPVPVYYPIDPALESVIKEHGAQLIDLRRPEGLTENDFMDDYHLSPQGGAIFTRELAQRLFQFNDFRIALRK